VIVEASLSPDYRAFSTFKRLFEGDGDICRGHRRSSRLAGFTDQEHMEAAATLNYNA
jgi:hypothetical protein